MAEVRSDRDLLVWQRALDLAAATYELSRAYPREAPFGLTSQTRRTATSVATDIAEGYGRSTTPAYLNFLRIAQGSLKELETHLILAERVGLTASGSTDRLVSAADELGRMLNSLISKLQSHSAR